MKKCIFPGSFNPFTFGHKSLIKKALIDFDNVIVAVADETYRTDVAPLDIRVDIAKKSLSEFDNVTVVPFFGMLTDFLVENKCFNVVRGYRSSADFEYEKELERAYISMEHNVHFILYPSDNDISADIVRHKIKIGEPIAGLVDDDLIDVIKKLYK